MLSQNNKTVYENLYAEIIKKIDERKKQQVEYVTTNLLDRDEYSQRVGQIQALEIVKEDFEHIFKVFFPST